MTTKTHHRIVQTTLVEAATATLHSLFADIRTSEVYSPGGPPSTPASREGNAAVDMRRGFFVGSFVDQPPVVRR
jgi:hypothetical protein